MAAIFFKIAEKNGGYTVFLYLKKFKIAHITRKNDETIQKD